jgi:hypothetical protein
VPSDHASQSRIAAELDLLPDGPLASANKISVAELDDDSQLSLCRTCAALIRNRLNVDIPDALVSAEMKRAITYLDIKEAYIYRDWQSAIGDLMTHDLANASRRFDVIGFGEFEERYLSANATGTVSSDKLWFSRIESLFYGLDMEQKGIFDARRDQIRKLSESSADLKRALAKLLELPAGNST